jgi:hypothetical protein
MAAATYPNKVRTFSPKVDLVDYIFADHINSLQNEVVSLEKTLGDNTGTVGTYSPLISTWSNISFDRTTITWKTVGDRLQNIENGLVNGVPGSPYVLRTGGSIVQPTTGLIGLVMKTVGGTANLFEARSTTNTLGFNIDYNGVPKMGTANLLYVGSSDYNNLVGATAAAANTFHPFFLAGC